MTRTGRVVAGVGATVLGLVALGLFRVFAYWLGLDVGSLAAFAFGALGLVVFAVVTAAFYTWAVDGRFVMRRRRGAAR